MSQTQCVRCRANKQNGDRCTRRTCKYSKYCYQHAKKLEGLKVTQSNIPNAGLGLFATKQFRKGQKVADYGGQIVSTASYRENPSGYGIQINRAVILDAKSTQSGLGRYANNCRKRDKQRNHCNGNNAKIVVNTRSRTATLRATKAIHAGQEVLTSGYGRAFHLRAS